MSDDLNTAVAIEAGKELAGAAPRIVHIAHPQAPSNMIPVALVTTTEGETTIVPLVEALEILDKREPFALRRDNLVRLYEAESLIAYVKRFGSERTLVYANTTGFEFTAVLDDHPEAPAGTPEDKAGWRAHRAYYACPRSPEWLAWTGRDGKASSQTEFADFIEGRLEDLVSADGFPRPVDILQVARNLNIRTKGQFQREMNPTNGDYIMVNKLETTSESTQIPRAFVIGVPVFEGGQRYQVECRIRFSIVGGTPQFSFVMHRRLEIERDAFNGVRSKIGTDTGRLILAGTP